MYTSSKFKGDRTTPTENHSARDSRGISVERQFLPHFKKGDSSSLSVNMSDNKNSSAVANFRDNVELKNEGSSTSRKDVNEVLELYRQILTEMEKDEKSKGGKRNYNIHLDAAKKLKEIHLWLNEEKRIGSVPGVEIGDKFLYRAELRVIGLHQQFEKGIDFMRNENGVLLATSIVNSNQYENEKKSPTKLIYSGQGGNPRVRSGQKCRDQVLEGGNLALYNSMDKKSPVRVIFKSSMPSMLKGTPGQNSSGSIFVYDGLYSVTELKEERGSCGKLVFNFHLERVPEQPLTLGSVTKSNRTLSCLKKTITNDISGGKEVIKIPVVNDVDGERPPQFIYIAKMNYKGVQIQSISDGCDCIGNCSSCEDCLCKEKNGGEIPYDNRGHLVRRNPFIYECGSSCKCPDSCFNRVTQFGGKKQLEVFRTEAYGWGVRSTAQIAANTFICEYVGSEIFQDTEAKRRLANDAYLFRLGNFEHSSSSNKNGVFTIDASTSGNVARFINHSSPNLYVQNVLYDHGDIRLPHIMLFTRRDIAPYRELTYDYSDKLGMNQNVQAKD